MQGILDRSLLVVTGKGGVGKSTIAAALGLLAAESGRRTIVVEVGEQSRLAELVAGGADAGEDAQAGSEVRVAPNLYGLSIDLDRALLEWLQALGGRVSGRILASSGTFQYFAAAAPGARELISMVKIWKLTSAPRRGGRGYDLVILDAPATGHALGMLRSPQTFGSIARVGPVASQTASVQELLGDPARSGFLAVALGSEMAVTETIELRDGLRAAVERDLDGVVVNALLPRRFNGPELERIQELANGGARRAARDRSLLTAAAHAARAAHDRANFQHGQVARLRRRHFDVLPVPFLWGAELDLDALQQIAARLGQALGRSAR